MAGKGDVHIVPENDMREHEETIACWCAPTLKPVEVGSTLYVVVHHPLDGRELVEQHGVN